VTPALGADDGAPPPCAQRSLGVEARGSIALTRTAGIGATSPFAPVPGGTVCPPPLSFKFVVAKGRFGSASGRWPDLSPVQPTVEANWCRYSETVLPGRLPTAMDLVKIAHLLAAVAPARVDFLARRLDQPSNRPVPRGTGARLRNIPSRAPPRQ